MPQKTHTFKNGAGIAIALAFIVAILYAPTDEGDDHFAQWIWRTALQPLIDDAKALRGS